ncbi:MAG: NAD(P)H-hydrate dehydratase [Rubrobacter sp.]|nr:NAD(P)H-hydrate dehydratase [Rubrobacter sp.]
MSRADNGAQELGIPGGILMERASVGMARAALERFRARRALVVCGGGNNGGDGFVIARELHRAGVGVAVLPTKDEYSGDPEVNLAVLRNLCVEVIGPKDLDAELERTDLVVDALLGTGFRGAVREDVARLVEGINGSPAPVVSVDVPSGVDGSTGEVAGAAVRADLTVCGHAVKVGCAVSPGLEHAGEVVAVDIGLPQEADVEPSVEGVDGDSLRGVVPRTRGPAHKYSAGSLLVVAGARQMTGAAVMAVKGAQRAGCGIVFLAIPSGAALGADLELTEAIVSGAPESEEGYFGEGAAEHVLERAEQASALAVGPGIGPGGRELVEGLLTGTDLPVLLDADAVTSLAGSGALLRRSAPAVMTPHAGELGRLLGVGAGEVSGRRLHHARRAAEEHGCTVLLKGADTLVAEGGRTAVVRAGGVALATAGTGDVLTGVIGALLSRGMDPYGAACAGAWAHGRASELWLEETGWPAESLTATDLLPHLPGALGELL